jgi:hypothetical protein
MFDRRYLVKIYLGGQGVPILEFFVDATSVVVEEHTVTIDGTKLTFDLNNYVSAEKTN